MSKETGRQNADGTLPPSPARRSAASPALLAACALCCLALLVSCLWGTAFAAGPPGASPAQVEAGAGKVVIVVIDRIGLEDLTAENSPNILRLVKVGESALMNARVRNDQYGEGGYVVLGAGGRAIGGPNAELAFNSDEVLRALGGQEVAAGALFRARTGLPAPPGSVLHLYIEEMKRKSDVPQASSLPGMMGQAAREAGMRVAVLGNADSLAPAAQALPGSQTQPVTPVAELPGSGTQATLLHREIACVAMDGEGRVAAGDVGSGLFRPSRSAAGVTTDFDALLGGAKAALPETDLLVIDMGQTSRVDEQANFYSDHALEKARGRALKMCDAALGRLLESLDLRRETVVVCVPTPTRRMIANGKLLTPVVFAGPGFRPGGQLSSATTRRTGLVSNFDIAPTALDILGVEVPAEMDGRPLARAPGEPLEPLPGDQAAAGQRGGGLAGLERFEDRAAGASVSRKAMVRVYAVTAIIIVLLLLLLALTREEWISRHRLLWSAALLSLLAGPLAYLVAPAFGIPALYWMLPASILISVALALASLLLGRRTDTFPLRPLAAVSGATALAVLLDIALGSPLMTFSPFGSDVMMADRYYGIGNLFMGFALGSTLLFGCLAVTVLEPLDGRARRYTFCVVLFAIMSFLVGFGRLGANFGGLAAALVGSVVTVLKLSGSRLGFKKLALGLVVVVALLALVLAADTLLPGASSHAGRAVERAGGSGGASAFAQAARKLAANWALTWASIWRLVLLALFVSALWLNSRHRLFPELRSGAPAVYAALVGMGFALPVALLLNDSGIEAAAAIGVFLFVPCLLMIAWRMKTGATGVGVGSGPALSAAPAEPPGGAARLEERGL